MAKPKVFLSYASRDGGMALEFAMLLEQRGIPAFCALDTIKPGDDWNEHLRQALIDCDELILLVSPESVDSDWVLMEVGAAWVLRKRITPILLFGSPADLPSNLQRMQYATLTSVGSWEGLLKQIYARHELKTQVEPTDIAPERTFRLPPADDDPPPRNDSPPMTIAPFQPNWVHCPCCKRAFSLQNQNSWTGSRHKTCGQRLVIAEPTHDSVRGET